MCNPNGWLKERCGRKNSATIVYTECAGKVISYRGDGTLIIRVKLMYNEIYKH
jgi:hypothetical protein